MSGKSKSGRRDGTGRGYESTDENVSRISRNGRNGDGNCNRRRRLNKQITILQHRIESEEVAGGGAHGDATGSAGEA